MRRPVRAHTRSVCGRSNDMGNERTSIWNAVSLRMTNGVDVW